jgi:ankyrin repeat protein
MNEIPYCLDTVHIDVNNPPSGFSPLHYLAGETYRTRITLELMALYGSSPLLSFKGETLLRLACKTEKERLAEELIKRVGLNNRAHRAEVEKEISNTPKREI